MELETNINEWEDSSMELCIRCITPLSYKINIKMGTLDFYCKCCERETKLNDLLNEETTSKDI